MNIINLVDSSTYTNTRTSQYMNNYNSGHELQNRTNKIDLHVATYKQQIIIQTNFL